MGKGQADALIKKINVLIPHGAVMPPLQLGYVIWDQSVVAEIYKSIQEYRDPQFIRARGARTNSTKDGRGAQE